MDSNTATLLAMLVAVGFGALAVALPITRSIRIMFGVIAALAFLAAADIYFKAERLQSPVVFRRPFHTVADCPLPLFNTDEEWMFAKKFRDLYPDCCVMYAKVLNGSPEYAECKVKLIFTPACRKPADELGEMFKAACWWSTQSETDRSTVEQQGITINVNQKDAWAHRPPLPDDERLRNLLNEALQGTDTPEVQLGQRLVKPYELVAARFQLQIGNR
jgi:hypothetical protein